MAQVVWKHLPKLLPRKFRRFRNAQHDDEDNRFNSKQPDEFMSGVEQTLLRVLSIVSDEMMELSLDIRGIKCSTYGVISVLANAEVQQRSSEGMTRWFIKLEEVVYEAEELLDELSYEISRQKVQKKSFERSHILKKLENVNGALQMIHDEAKDRWRQTESSGMTFRFRLCSGFCSSFPKDFLIQKTELIQLWMAAGLLQSLEEANYCFENHIRPDLKCVQKDEDGNGAIYKIDHESSSEHKNTSRVSFLHATTSTSIPMDNANKLRTLIIDRDNFQDSWKLERLGILVFFNSIGMSTLPPSIERMKHLRYLDVSNTRIKTLPEFITKLYNLETLRFLQCKELNDLPTQLNSLINLKNIAFSFEHQIPFRLGLMSCLKTLSFFAVGSNRGGGIHELRHLNGLRGHLEITRLEEVRDRKEAETANLQQKATVDELSLQWSFGADDRSSRDEEVLEGLRPRPQTRKIKIKYYMGKKWPSWTLRRNSLSNGGSFALRNLVSLALERCWNCVQLPCLGDLPYLRFLTLRYMHRLKCIYNELYGDSNYPRCLFPALRSLSLSWMDNLTDWCSSERPLDDKNVVMFPLLKRLSVLSCAKLMSFPLKDSSGLEKMEIKDCDELRFLFHEKQSFLYLAHLSIEGCSKLIYFRSQFLSNWYFSTFKVRRCQWLRFISEKMWSQNSLVSLEINCCRGLEFFSGEILCKLDQLKKLSIGAFSEKLDDFSYLSRIKDLPCLEELEIWGSDFFGRKMSHLPDQLQNLTKLKSLKIMGFTTMEELPRWLTNLQSLRSISLNYCWHLEYQSTATVIQRLSELKQVYINGCHDLKQNKSQWNKFSRVTKIGIHFSDMEDIASSSYN